MCWCAEEKLLAMNHQQQLLQWMTQSGKSEVNPEGDRCRSEKRRGASAAAASDWSLRSAEGGLPEPRASEKPANSQQSS